MHRLSRRHVLATLSSASVMLCPALLRAQTVPAINWGDIPTTEPIGQDRLISLDAGPAELDITDLQPGEIAVIARPNSADTYSNTGQTQYVAVHRRTDEQVAYGQANDRPGTVQDPGYFVTDLVCPHRGKAIGFTGSPDAPFACTDQGRRHSSVFDASGMGFSGASDGDPMSIPDYTLEVSEGAVVLRLA